MSKQVDIRSKRFSFLFSQLVERRKIQIELGMLALAARNAGGQCGGFQH